jgi:hypothetical protein
MDVNTGLYVEDKPRERWKSVIWGTLVFGTFVGVFFWSLVDNFAGLDKSDPFAYIFAPAGLLLSAVFAFFAAAGVAMVLED